MAPVLPAQSGVAGARLRRGALGALVVCAVVGLLPLAVEAANPIQIENANAGTTAWQITNAATNHEIEGYASLASVNRGSQIVFYVNTADPSFTIRIFRMGWYGGTGAREMTSSPIALAGVRQPACPIVDSSTSLLECNWSSSYVLSVPTSSDPTVWTSGVYLALLTGSSGKQSYIIFVVRDDARASTYLFQSCVTTFQAYSAWGGKSLYGFNSTNSAPAYKVSFNRPYDATYGMGAGEFLVAHLGKPGWEYNMLRWLERQGYDVSYTTDVDTHEAGSRLLSHAAFLSVGHDEYWSWQMRANVQAARDAGVHLGFFGSNAIYWQIRFEPSTFSGAADRTIVGYKEQAQSLDPDAQSSSTSYLTTTQWRLSPVNLPEDALIGVMYRYNDVSADIVIDQASNWVFSGSGVSSGTHLTGLLGYEVDQMFGDQPGNTVRLAHSPYLTGGGTQLFSDMTIYQASSGAWVFATGSNWWSWGLDDYNVPALRTSVLNSAAQKITANILARFAVPPLTLAFTNPAAGAGVSGTVTVSVAAAGGTGGYAYTISVDGTTLSSGGSAAVSWNTLTVSNGSHTLSAVVTDSSGATATASRSVSVSNVVLTAAFTSPAPGSTVGGIQTIAMASSGAAGSSTFVLTIDGGVVSSQTVAGASASYAWNTTSAANGAHALALRVTDGAGRTASASLSLTVSNAPFVAAFVTPASGETDSGIDAVTMTATGAIGPTTFSLAVDGTPLVAQTTTAGSIGYAWDTAIDTNGTHTLVLTITDASGRTATATRTVRVANAKLLVTPLGTGSGSVTSAPAGGACPPPAVSPATQCEGVAPGTQVTVTATPAVGSTFDGWSGACAGFGACAVALVADTSVGATFTAASPAIASWQAGRLDVFMRGPDNTLRHRFFAGAWSDWESLGGVVVSDPGVVSWGPGRIDVVARGADGAIWHLAYDGSAWAGWESLGGASADRPVVTSWGPGRLDVFVHGTDNQLWHKFFDAGGWSPWEPLGGVIVSAPAAVSWGAGRLDVFAEGSDGALYHKVYDRGWSDWQPQGGALSAAPGASSWGVGRIDVFVKGSDGMLWHEWLDNGAASGPWEGLGQAIASAPAAVSWGPSRIDLFAGRADGTLLHEWYAGGWSAELMTPPR